MTEYLRTYLQLVYLHRISITWGNFRPFYKGKSLCNLYWHCP